jgi:SAM-dependent methyltransferase
VTDQLERLQRQQASAFLLKRARSTKGPILELFANSGELTRALSSEGLEVLGVEPQEPPPSRIAELAHATPTRILRADPRALRLEQRFALVLAVGSALRRPANGEELEQVLATAAAHLAPGGELILEMSGLTARVHAREHALQHLGTAGIAGVRGDPSPYRMPFTPHLARRGAGRQAISRLALLALAPSELLERLAATGLVVRSLFGDYDERPFDADAPRMVCVAGRDAPAVFPI